MIGQANALIQEIANRKTKFVNVNRLRAYNASIAEWAKYKNKDKNASENADMQQEKNGSDNLDSAIATAPRFAEFDVDNEVTLLNPELDPVPRPCPDIKVEGEELETSVDTQTPDNEAPTSNLDPIPSTSKTNRRESLLETATKMFSPTKNKPMTRATRIDRGLELETQSGETLNQELKEAEKSKKKSQKKK